MTRGRRLPLLKKTAFAVATIVAFFVLLEGLLMVAGMRPIIDTSDPFVGFSSLPLFVEKEGSASAEVTTAKNKLAFFNEQTFLREKPSGTFRIFCMGGSTTYGRPYDDSTSFAGWLRRLLPLADDRHKWEVINTGGISYASYRVATLMDELAQYQPDLFIVYTGHNEFLEQRTYANIQAMSTARMELTASLARTRTYSLIHKVLNSNPAAPSESTKLTNEVDALLDHSVGPEDYLRDEKLRQEIISHFEFNLTRMIAIARKSKAAIIFVTPASNLKDFSPFKSQHGVNADLTQWQALYNEANSLAEAGELEKAIDKYKAAVEYDDRFAELYYRQGRALMKLERYSEAAVSFRRAIDEDICPLRALSNISTLISRTAKQLNVPLVDFHAKLQNECVRKYGHNILGYEFFLDHVHPNISTNRMVATEIIDELVEQQIVQPTETWNADAIEQLARDFESTIDERSHAVALRNLAKVLNWAGKHREAGPLAMKALETLPKDPECLFLSGCYLKIQGNPQQAIKHFRETIEHRPEYPEAHQFLGAALVDEGQYEEALAHFKQLAQLRPQDDMAHHMVGAVLAELKRFDEALPHYRTAIRLNANDSNIHYNLAFALAELGRRLDAIGEYRIAIRLNPNDADAHNNLGALLVKEKQFPEAILHYKQALQNSPDSADIQENLRIAIEENKQR